MTLRGIFIFYLIPIILFYFIEIEDPFKKHHLNSNTESSSVNERSIRKLKNIENIIKGSGYHLIHLGRLKTDDKNKFYLFETTAWYAAPKYKSETDNISEELMEFAEKFKS